MLVKKNIEIPWVHAIIYCRGKNEDIKTVVMWMSCIFSYKFGKKCSNCLKLSICFDWHIALIYFMAVRFLRTSVSRPERPGKAVSISLSLPLMRIFIPTKKTCSKISGSHSNIFLQTVSQIDRNLWERNYWP